MRNLAVAASTISAFVACSSPSGPGPGENLGQASIALMQVPSDVACVQVTVSGARTVTRPFDVTAGQDATFAVGQLPLGVDVFSAIAFSTDCSGTTATSVPNWVGDPVTVTLSVGIVADVHLVLRRSGRASVGIDFQDDAGSACESGCAPACVPGQRQCEGNVPQICDAAGQWQSIAACPGSCLDGACN